MSKPLTTLIPVCLFLIYLVGISAFGHHKTPNPRASALHAAAQPLSEELELNVKELQEALRAAQQKGAGDMVLRGRIAAHAERIRDLADELSDSEVEPVGTTELALTESYLAESAKGEVTSSAPEAP